MTLSSELGVVACACARARRSITSSSVSPRMTYPHSHVICLAMSASLRRVELVVRARRWDYVGATLARGKVQLCGRFVVDGRRPPRRGRAARAGRAGCSSRTSSRTALRTVDARRAARGALAGRPRRRPRAAPLEAAARRARSTGCARRRRALGRRRGGAATRCTAPSRALALGRPARAWGPSQVAMFVTGRPFLAGEEAPGSTTSGARSAGCTSARSRRTPRRRSAIGGTELAAAVRVGARARRASSRTASPATGS